MEVTFLTKKLFPDNREVLILKNGNRKMIDDVPKLFRDKSYKLKQKECIKKRLQWLYEKVSLFPDDVLDRKIKLCELALCRDLDDVRRSCQRVKQNLYDLLRSNDFGFFVTLTFDPERIDRLDDKAVRYAWTEWGLCFRRKFPKAYYVAVPEYHKKGGLHFHVLLGGVSFDALKPIHAYDEKKKRYLYVTKGVCKGDKIYNIDVWRHGWSTMTILRNTDAAKHYVAKYITKQGTDSRFFGKKRYYASRNLLRPVIEKQTIALNDQNPWCLDDSQWQISYVDYQKQYGVFESRCIKRGEFYGFWCDIADCKVKNSKVTDYVRKWGINRTMRKSLLVELGVPKAVVYSQKRKKSFDDSLIAEMQSRIEYTKLNPFGTRLLSVDTSVLSLLESVGL